MTIDKDQPSIVEKKIDEQQIVAELRQKYSQRKKFAQIMTTTKAQPKLKTDSAAEKV